MKKVGVVIVILFVIAVFNRCGQVSSLSGKYINEQDSSKYLKFSGESTVVLASDGEKIKGTYSIYEDAVMLIFGSGDNMESVILEIKNKNTLIYGIVGVAYVKRGFWNYYLKRILLFCFIAYAISFVVNIIKDIKKGCNDAGMTVKEAWKQAGEEERAEYKKDIEQTRAENEKDMEEAQIEIAKAKEEWKQTKEELKEEWKDIKETFKQDMKNIKKD